MDRSAHTFWGLMGNLFLERQEMHSRHEVREAKRNVQRAGVTRPWPGSRASPRRKIFRRHQENEKKQQVQQDIGAYIGLSVG